MNINLERYSKILLDFILWFCSILLASLLRFDGKFPSGVMFEIFKLTILASSLYLCTNFILSLYSRRYQKASIEEFIAISISVSISTLLIFTYRLVFTFPNLPRSVPIISGLILLILSLASRIFYRNEVLNIFLRNKSIGENTVIYGAGTTGRQLLEQMLISHSQYNPVGYIDDDINKSNLRILGRPILGNINILEKIIKSHQIKILIVAISNIDSKSLLKIEEKCQSFGVSLRIIPNFFALVSGTINLADIHDVAEEDLLGRVALKTDEGDILNYFKGKRVLVTGAGGSIGSEISRQLSRYSLEELYMLDRDETALLGLELSLKLNLGKTGYELILADIRDVDRVNEIFQSIKPDIVFHAAALKHLNFLEKFPDEARKTNILGTQNVLNAATNTNVNTFINISTDKAAQPSSVLGRSKLLTEQLTAGVNMKDTESKYLSVRFGNVIGSNGSFINTFRIQIKNGGPVTVTHPEVTRYFMTISEAVHLVLKSAVIGKSGETLILEMGEPMKIDLIARRMISASGRDIKIIYTGLNPGEKLNEVLFNSDEKIEKSENNYIMRTKVKPLSGD